VLAKAAKRIREGVPIALTLDDYAVLSAQLKAQTKLTPTRRGDQATWSEVRPGLVEVTFSLGWQMSDLRDAFGLVEDGIELRFNPNLSTAQFLQLARYLEDPGATDPEWEELFRKRRLGHPPWIPYWNK
jgi:hypothetical protein